MPASGLELMLDHVRAIHRSVTGQEVPEREAPKELPSLHVDDVARRFAELETLARGIPTLAERLAPFSFAPPLDVIGTERELVVELGVPGIESGEVQVELVDGTLIVAGARRETSFLDGRVYFHTEMPRGPFRRVVRLPEPVSGQPRLEVENGVVRIKLARAARSPLPRA